VTSELVLDASTVIAFLDAHDAHHAAAASLLVPHATERATLYMHVVNVAEVLVRPVMAGREDAALNVLAELGVVTDDVADPPLVLARLRAVTGLKMPDCCALAVAQRRQLELLTFDDRLAAAARSGR